VFVSRGCAGRNAGLRYSTNPVTQVYVHYPAWLSVPHEISAFSNLMGHSQPGATKMLISSVEI
jgi:hypothetical protein